MSLKVIVGYPSWPLNECICPKGHLSQAAFTPSMDPAHKLNPPYPRVATLRLYRIGRADLWRVLSALNPFDELRFELFYLLNRKARALGDEIPVSVRGMMSSHGHEFST